MCQASAEQYPAPRHVIADFSGSPASMEPYLGGAEEDTMRSHGAIRRLLIVVLRRYALTLSAATSAYPPSSRFRTG
jgi:hypothetical protein